MSREVVFLSRMGTGNVGDNLCSPYLYFKQSFPAARHVEFHLGEWKRHRLYLKAILSPILIRSKMLIIGGGGLLGLELFADDMRFWCLAPFCPKVLWGPGHNSHNVLAVDHADPSVKDYTQLKKFDRIGIRDWNVEYSWVPCASCMNPAFSEPTSESGGIVAALHYESRLTPEFIPNIIKASPKPIDIVFNDDCPETFIGKLRSAKSVVTNSYHAAYWATLLGKRVAVVGGGSKVRLLKHRPILASIDRWAQMIEECQIYPHALEECRDRNTEYCNEIVHSYL